MNSSKQVITTTSMNGFEMNPEHKQILNSIIQKAYKFSHKFTSPPMFFETGYTGVLLEINLKKYYLLYNTGIIGLEDHTTSSIYLRPQSTTTPEWIVKQSYCNNFGDISLRNHDILLAQQKFSEWMNSIN